MCYKIDSEVVIANFFAECEEIAELQISKLIELKGKIEDKFNESESILFVDTSRRSIENAVYTNSKYFSFDELKSKIIFNNSKRQELYEDVYFIYNSKIEMKIKFKILGILEKCIEEETKMTQGLGIKY